MTVRFMMSVKSGNWYLNMSSNFKHSYHAAECADSTLLNKTAMNHEEMNFLKLMYENGVVNSTLADIMTKVMNKGGKQGEFLSSTMQNVTTKIQEAMDEIEGVDPDWSVAQTTVHRLRT